MSQALQQKRDVRELLNSERAKLEIAKVLPKHLTAERMTRVALTAILKTPKLLDCVPESLLNAVLLCSQAGLEPDSRLAHLIPYGNQVQVIFDYKGLVTLMRRNGAELVYADKVCEHDVFEAFVENGEKKLLHKINWKAPRGNAYLYYAVTRLKGAFDYEVMTMDEIEGVRQRSKCANSGPWVTDFDEMAKKTVLRRMSKRWDLLPEIRDVINADDDAPQFDKPVVSAPIFALPPSSPPVTPATDNNEFSPADNASAGENKTERRESASSTSASGPSAPAPAGDKDSPVKAVRAALKSRKITEGALLDHLAKSGSTQGDCATLEEVHLNYKGLLTFLMENWVTVADALGNGSKVAAIKGE